MKSLRIMMVSNNYSPYCGGVVSSIDTAIHELQKLGHVVTLVTLDFLGKEHKDPSHVVRIPCSIKFVYKKNHMALPLRAQKYMDHYVQEFKPDIIHSHHPTLLGIVALKSSHRYKIPCVFTYHTLYESYAHYFPFPQKLMRRMIKKRVNEYCRKVQHIIVPSEPVQRILAQQDIITPMTVMPTGLHPIFVVPFVPRVRNIEDPLRLLYVGRFTKEKNVQFLIDLLVQLKHKKIPYDATFIGYGSEEKVLQNYAYEHQGLSHNSVHFIHKPSKNIIAHHYQRADMFLFPSQTDTQGIVLAEAMAAGVPVIALHGPGQEMIIEQGKNGFIVRSLQEMSNSIEMVHNDPNAHATMRFNAWQTAQTYSPGNMGLRLAGIYTQILT